MAVSEAGEVEQARCRGVLLRVCREAALDSLRLTAPRQY